uniref:Microtubule-associated protein 1B/S N-terminal domain-containing protein n=1 Tax=Xiphophorus couchianus TaxID=32473 RepID=A0A3B5KYV8_9TELE
SHPGGTQSRAAAPSHREEPVEVARASVLRLTLKALFFSFPAGIRSWDVNLKCCDLDQQLPLFITRHSAHFSSKVRGQLGIEGQIYSV